jgi:hypothetical protein
MKKLLIIFCMLFVLPVFADTQPYYMNNIPRSALGLYQTGEAVTIYSEPDVNSKVIRTIDFSYNPETNHP